ncbi:MAG TPA: ABC transporter permease [Longimicrobiales bacterium]
MSQGRWHRRWLRGPGRVWDDVDEELAFHFEQRVRDYEARGMDPESARAAARERMGDVERARREAARELAAQRRSESRRSWLKVSALDFKLGLRMLVRYPGLTIIGGLAMAFAIWVGIGTFEFIAQVVHPRLPFEDGDRIVAIELWNAEESREERRVLHDFVAWREQLRTVEELGAWRAVERNLITGDGVGEPVDVAEMTAAGFRVTGIAPLLGRTLQPADERADAPAVVVLGHDLWVRRFGADPGVVGSVVRLGREPATVVGVMPEGFAFPVSHGLWAPLRLNPLEHERGRGPAIRVFGRLAPGVSLEEAQTELTALGRRAAAAYPETHAHLRPRVMPYARSVIDVSGWVSLGIVSINGFIVALLVLVSGNVALLLFARAAAREGEIVVRSALGASRGRIIGQLFVEALVLAAGAAVVGLLGARSGMRWAMGVYETTVLGDLPFWFHDTLSPGSVVYTLALTLLAATVAGVLPALKVTGRDLAGRLRRGSAGGGARFGGVWTTVIVAQVAVTMFCALISYVIQREMAEIRSRDPGFPVEEYLSVMLRTDDDPAPAADDAGARAERQARARAAFLALEQRLAAEPWVAGVTFASAPPGASHPWRRIEVDAGGAVPEWEPPGYRVRVAAVATDYFDVLGTRISSGRGFTPADVEAGRAVIVNTFFVDSVLGGRNPIGRRVRYLPGERDAPGSPGSGTDRWYEIVGVVDGLRMDDGASSLIAGIFHPVAPAAAGADRMIVHVRGDPASFAPRLRRLAAEVDPTLRLVRPVPLEQFRRDSLRLYGFWSLLIGALTLVALILSWAGIYAVLSFDVTRRTREIGVRVALGGDARRVLLALFRRPMLQVGLGVGVGTLAILVLHIITSDPGREPLARQIAQIGAYATVMMGVCMLACIVPARRALRIEPMEALRVEG